jgi:hypothetical protein
LFGQTNRNGNQFYRHCHTERNRSCNGPEFKSWVKAEEIGDAVIRELFECFGNPQAVKRAIEAATPNLAKIKEDQERVTKLEKMLERVKRNRARTLGLRDKELISEEVETNRLKELKAEEDRYLEERNRLNNNLQNMPTPEAIQEVSTKIAAKFKNYRYCDARLIANVRHANHAFDEMTWTEKRALVETVFSGKTTEGKREGVFVEWLDDPKFVARGFKWKYTVKGSLMDDVGGLLPMSETLKDAMIGISSVESALH